MRIPSCLVALGLVAGLAAPASGAESPPSERSESRGQATSEGRDPVQDGVRFLGGFSAGLFLHESAHMATGAALGARPRIDRLSIPLPFIVVHYDPVSRRREFAIASSGFWMQHLVSEWLLTAAAGAPADGRTVPEGTVCVRGGDVGAVRGRRADDRRDRANATRGRWRRRWARAACPSRRPARSSSRRPCSTCIGITALVRRGRAGRRARSRPCPWGWCSRRGNRSGMSLDSPNIRPV